MNDLQSFIEARLSDAVAAALGAEFADADPMIAPARNPKFGDYQANLAMGLAKRLGKKPRELADAIVTALNTEGAFSNVEIAGPGFINLTLEHSLLVERAAGLLADAALGVEPVSPPQTVVVDYSSPNVAKEMHIGHLRSTIIGDAIVRVLAAQGHNVIKQNHVGDWGTQFGMLIEHLVEVVDAEALAAMSFDIGDLNAFYQEAKRKFDDDEGFADRSRQRVVALQGGDRETYSLWRALYVKSLEHFADAYEQLGVLLVDEDIRGESAYNDALPLVVERLEGQGMLAESEGAQVVYPEGFKGKDGEPMPMIVRKSDGGFLYATTDLAAAEHRIGSLKADRVVYVTDARQSQHFAMVFQTLRQANWAPETIRLDHVPFGTIMGKDRKPFKTRTGGTVKLADVMTEAVQRADNVIAEKNPDMPAGERAVVAKVVGMGALKYADLSNDRIKDYIFDWDRMLALEGNTSPYLQYSYARICSIFRKGGVAMDDAAAYAITPDALAEKALVLKLLQLPRVVDAVSESLEPHRLCTYLYELASAYHSFYEKCTVLKAEDEATKQSRLALCALVARTLKEGLGLLGIGVVERM